jgi:homoserine kinase
VTSRRRLVRVPASSGNLGPGYDVLGAALSLFLELEVSESPDGEFSIEPGGEGLPADRSNLIVSSFERLHPADGLRFEVVGNEIPIARGLGSSAAAILAGLMAADHLFELGNSREDLFAHACALEGHPDNVAAALYGGITVCSPPGAPFRETPPDPVEIAAGAPAPARVPVPARLAPPEGVETLVVIPAEQVPTEAARAAMPAEVPIADAAHNVAAASHLVLGIERSDLTLIERGLSDRLHQPHRRPLYERSMEVVEAARDLGALGATISGAGPTVLVWSYWQSSSDLSNDLAAVAGDWAQVSRVPFSPFGAAVEL